MTNQELMQKLEQLFRLYIPAHSKFQPTIAALREALAEQPAQQASGTEWLVCPKCAHQSPYTAVKAKTLAEEAELITKQARAALAQMKPAQQEPVASLYDDGTWIAKKTEAGRALNDRLLFAGSPAIDVYTHPQAREALTDAQIESTFIKCGGRWSGDHWVIEDADLHPFVRTIESPELSVLRAISDEYNAWIKHHAAGHTYDDFLAKRTAHGINKDDGFAAKAA